MPGYPRGDDLVFLLENTSRAITNKEGLIYYANA